MRLTLTNAEFIGLREAGCSWPSLFSDDLVDLPLEVVANRLILTGKINRSEWTDREIEQAIAAMLKEFGYKECPYFRDPPQCGCQAYIDRFAVECYKCWAIDNGGDDE